MAKQRQDGDILPALWALGGAFLAGGIAGCFLVGAVQDTGGLSSYLHEFVAAARDGGMPHPGLLSILWEQLRWPLFAVLLGMTALGLPGLPVLFAVRGFFLAYTAGAFVRVFGAVGGLLAVPALGVAAALTLPALFVLGVGAWSRLRSGGTPLGEPVRYLLCGSALCAGVFLEYFLAPMLFQAVAARLI